MNDRYNVAIHHVDGTVEWIIDSKLSTPDRSLAGLHSETRARQLASRINCELKWDDDTIDDVAYIVKAS